MNRMWLRALLLLVLAAAVPACDDRPRPAAPAATPPRKETPLVADTRPATQAILAERRERKTMGRYPLSLEVPADDWKVAVTDTEPALTMLEGPSPHADIHIVISKPPSITRQGLDLLVQGEKGVQAQNPTTVKLVDLRPLGRGQVLETQSLKGPATQPKRYEWRLTVFVPGEGEEMARYVLDFVNLKPDEYQQDEQFLKGIVSSLRIESAH